MTTARPRGWTGKVMIGVCVALPVGAAVLVSCSGAPRSSGPLPERRRAAAAPVVPPAPSSDKPADLPGVHNVVAFHHGFYSGSVPEGDAGFDTLAAMGVRTVISVDGAEPDVAAARARGMRYIHLPIGYNGFDEQRRLELARATRDAMNEGPVYIHCHHGKHRSAGAAGAVVASLGWGTPEQGVERMHVSGTSPGYTGLFQCVMESAVVSAAALDEVAADFPEVSPPPTFVRGMVELDHVWDHLAAVENAGWTVPPDHPDLVPAAEAGRLVDLFRAMRESDYTRGRPAEFAELLKKDEERAQQLEDWITAGNASREQLSAQWKLITTSCKECHVKHRDKSGW